MFQRFGKLMHKRNKILRIQVLSRAAKVYNITSHKNVKLSGAGGSAEQVPAEKMFMLDIWILHPYVQMY